MVAHTFNPSLGTQKQADLCESKASLVFRASSRTVKAEKAISKNWEKNKIKKGKKRKREVKEWFP